MILLKDYFSLWCGVGVDFPKTLSTYYFHYTMYVILDGCEHYLSIYMYGNPMRILISVYLNNCEM